MYKLEVFHFLPTIILMLCDVTSAATEISSRNAVLLEEVTFGETVVLKCRSNDGNYNFDYWLLNNGGIVIGPANENYDNAKYKYEVLSGDLTVRCVSKQEEGQYSCVSRSVRGKNIKVESVKVLIGQRNWQEVYEHDTHINTIRILIILITLVLLGIGGFVVWRIWVDRFKYPTYLEQYNDEESGDEDFQVPENSGTPRTRSPGRIIVEKNKGAATENFNISTDFASFLDTSNQN